MDAKEDLPSRSYRFLTLEVVDWTGPIVEITFDRAIDSIADAGAAVREASLFMRTLVAPRSSSAFFITCYDGLSVTREPLSELQQRFIEFNEKFSVGDVRYGGSHFAKTFVVATSIQSASRSNHFESRADALVALREKIRLAGDGR